MPIRFKTEEERKNHPLANLIGDSIWFDPSYFGGELDDLSEHLLSKDYDFFHKENCELPQNQVYSKKHLYCIILHSQDLTLEQCQYLMEKMNLNQIELAEVLIRTQCSEPLETLIESNHDDQSLNEIYRLSIRYNDLKSLKILEKKFVNNGKDKAYIAKFLAANDFDVYTGAILGNSLSVLEHFHSHLNFNFASKPALLTQSLNLLKSSAQSGGTDCLSGLINLFRMNGYIPEEGYYEAFTRAALNGHINYLKILIDVYIPSPNKIDTLYHQVILKHNQPSTLKFLESIRSINPVLFFDFEKQLNWYTLALQHERKEVFFHLLTKNIDAILHFAHSKMELTQQYIQEYMITMLNTDLEEGEDTDQRFDAFITILTFLKHNPNFLINDHWQKLLEVEGMSEFISAEEIRQGINTNHSSNPINAPDPIESSDKTLPQIESKEVANNPVQEALINDMLPLQPDPEKIAQNSITHVIATAYTKYEQHTRGIRFCLFHIHGEKGIARANKFKQTFNENQTLQEQYDQVLAYLQDDTNGNTHPHSFRTMLLAKLLNKDLSSNEALRDISEGFSTYLEQYRSCFTLNNLSNLNNN